jgi:hypothetical protein
MCVIPVLVFLVCGMTRLPEDDADASKLVVVPTIYKILLMYICCAFVALDNKIH